ncbi:MAG: hypothetical protein ACKO6N_12440 [Myxococcota bacterium]
MHEPAEAQTEGPAICIHLTPRVVEGAGELASFFESGCCAMETR